MHKPISLDLDTIAMLHADSFARTVAAGLNCDPHYNNIVREAHIVTAQMGPCEQPGCQVPLLRIAYSVAVKVEEEAPK
jgi:hypothetical protein